jgi:hypothetical protein
VRICPVPSPQEQLPAGDGRAGLRRRGGTVMAGEWRMPAGRRPWRKGVGTELGSAIHRCPFPVTTLGLRPRCITGNPPVSSSAGWRRSRNHPSPLKDKGAVVPSVLQRDVKLFDESQVGMRKGGRFWLLGIRE